MPIIYALVARGTCVLAEYTATSGNFATITRRLLEKIPEDAERMSYVYDRHVFHYMVHSRLVFLCMSDEQFGTRIPFVFLEDVKNRWFSTYANQGASALAYGMNEDFSVVLNRQMVPDPAHRPPALAALAACVRRLSHARTHARAWPSRRERRPQEQHSSEAAQDADSISRVRGEIDQVRSVMVQNIEKVLERGEKIELLVDKTENLNAQAFRFKKQSTSLRHAMWWRNFKLTLALSFVGLLIALLIAMSACGMDFHKCRRHPDPAPP
jgi:vesicle-associated membrane protein 7